ncbi:PQQ-binding-like beta-propeller repeat protein, partial [Candidatus Calescamantes bacterium]|nr:PQQ-binding-like beta-propeller repeat protein [Candidatus Calescamantes bacterium]
MLKIYKKSSWPENTKSTRNPLPYYIFKKVLSSVLFVLLFLVIFQGCRHNSVGTDGTLKWKYTTGNNVFSSPAIGSDGTIYVGSLDGNLYAINPDGTLKWKYKTGGCILSPPAIDSVGTIYVGSSDRNLYAINPDGKLKWKFKTGGFLPQSFPAIGSDGTIYVGSNDVRSFYSNIYAINPDGTLKWKYTTGGWVSSPAIGSDGTIYVGSEDGNLYAINPDGTLKWKIKKVLAYFSSPAIGSDGTIYVGTFGDFNLFDAINPDGTLKWNGNLYAINPDGTLKWKYKTGAIWLQSSPAIGSDGTIYVGSLDGNLYAINPDGTLKWKFTTGDSAFSSPAIGSDGTIYVGSKDYNLYAINSDGTLKWKYTTGGWVVSSPAIGSDGTIYVGSKDGNLYAIYSSGTLANSPWPMLQHDLKHTGKAKEITARLKPEWIKTFGGSGYDLPQPHALQTLPDGNIIIAGDTYSYGAGLSDIYVIKIDKDGNKIWEKTFGGRGIDLVNALQTLPDGNIIIAGVSESYGAGYSDIYVIKIDKDGNKIWEKTFGESKDDEANALQVLPDGNIIIAGVTESYGAGGQDFYVIKIDKDGNKIWEKTFGESK